MEQYNVTGMSCAACSARVEKAVGKVPGVENCSVSLLTNSMGVEGTATVDAVIAAVVSNFNETADIDIGAVDFPAHRIGLFGGIGRQLR